MLRTMCKSRIHDATVTGGCGADAGVLVVDPDLMDAADLLAGERVTLVEAGTGGRLDVDVVAGLRGSGEFGCATHVGSVVTLVSSVLLDPAAARAHRVGSVRVDSANQIVAGRDGSHVAVVAAPPAETADATRLDALITPAR